MVGGGVRRCGLLAMAALLLAALLGVASGAADETTQKLMAGNVDDGDHAAVLRRLLNAVVDPPAGSWPPRADAVVAKHCGGGVAAPPPCYTSIQEALNGAPQEAEAVAEPPPGQQQQQDRYVVHVLAGVYDESLNITRRNVMLIGDGVGVTIITGNKSNATGTPMNMTATVNAFGHGFLAQDLTIRNTAGADGRQAVALRSNSNKSVVYRCSIEGHEDTLYAENGLQFYLQTSIWGTVDFVFGNAKAMFQSCSLLVRRPPEGKHNVLTAQGCNNVSRESGFSFHMCTVEAAPGVDLAGVETYLGRPYRNFSHVAFIKSSLGGVVSPSGWVAWDKSHVVEETTRTIMYREYGNDGAGADTAGRVKWPGFRVLNDAAEAVPYTADAFVNASLWVPEPIRYDHTLGAAPPLVPPPRA